MQVPRWWSRFWAWVSHFGTVVTLVELLLPAAGVSALVTAFVGAMRWTTGPLLFLVFGVAMLLASAVLAWWRKRPRSGLPVMFLAPRGAELEIVLEREEVHPFNAKANLVETKVTVRNLTDRVKHLGPIACNADDRPSSGINDYDVHQEKAALERKRNRLPGNIEPRGTVSGWLVWALAYQPQGGIGPFTLTTSDELGTQYVLRRERRGPEPEPPPQDTEHHVVAEPGQRSTAQEARETVPESRAEPPVAIRSEERPPYLAERIVQSDGKGCLLTLKFDATPFTSISVKCEVVDTNGSSTVVERRPNPSILGATEVAVLWPDDFQSVPAPGKYNVRWYIKDELLSTAAALSASGLLDPWQRVAIHSFVAR